MIKIKKVAFLFSPFKYLIHIHTIHILYKFYIMHIYKYIIKYIIYIYIYIYIYVYIQFFQYYGHIKHIYMYLYFVDKFIY